jgi:ABC-2 type transport system permease protein
LRDPSLWARLLYPLAAVIFGFYRTFTQTIPSSNLADGGSSLTGVGWLFGTLAFMTYIVVAALSLPVINREGRALYLLALSPLSARDILLAKWTFCVLPILALVEGALVVSSLILQLPVGAALLAALTLAALVVALSGAELLLSLFWPRLDWDNPRQQVSGTASIAGLLGGLVLVAATGALYILTLAWFSDQPLAALATGLGIFALSGLVIATVAVLAPRRLDGLLVR